ncbi:MAG TPA: selenite/tellurite reduction operon porin ExtI [Candidatus Deferrimicrobiaceae bacterium]|jgi:hypothetical protein
MRKSFKAGILFAAALGLAVGFAGESFAGPQMTFGPDDEGALQIDYKGQFQLVGRDAGSGPAKENSTMSMNFRRNRLALMGKYGDMFGLYVQTEFTEDQNINPLNVQDTNSGSNFELIDANFRIKLDERLQFNIGKFKYGFNRETLEACEAPLTLDRSLFLRAPSVATRDKGVGVWGNIAGGMFQYRADVTEGRKATTADATQPASSFRYGVRGHVSLLDPEKDYGYKGTYLGKKKVLTVGGAYQVEPKIAYADIVDKSGAEDYKGWTADLFFEYPIEKVGTVTVSGAYEDIDLGDLYKGANPDPSLLGLAGQKNGYYAKAGYLLPSTPLQFFGRYEKWRFASLNNDSNGAASGNVFDQKVSWYGAGANYYIKNVLNPNNDQALKLTFEWSKAAFDKQNATSKDFNTFTTQLQVVF